MYMFFYFKIAEMLPAAVFKSNIDVATNNLGKLKLYTWKKANFEPIFIIFSSSVACFFSNFCKELLQFAGFNIVLLFTVVLISIHTPLTFSTFCHVMTHKQIYFMGILCERPTQRNRLLWKKLWCVKTFTPPNQYFVESSLTAITSGLFAHSSSQKSWSSVKLGGDCLWITVFRSCYRFFIRLRCGLWLGHFNI